MAAPDDVSTPEDALDYSRRLYENIVDWYKVAETKAQVILSLDGIFTSFLTGSVLTHSEDARDTVGVFAWHTWTALILLTVTLAFSILSAVMCLVTRVMSAAEARRRYAAASTEGSDVRTAPESLWFFQSIAMFSEQAFCRRAANVNSDDEKAALNNQIYLLSGKVLKKHKWVNRGFGCAGAALFFFLLTGASYVWQIS